jgi:elongation factor P hydroxylase
MGRATLPQSHDEMQRGYVSAALEVLFAECFAAQLDTVLQGGAEEPVYLPAQHGSPARIIYTRDYFRSALHEIAHWCVAGPARRRLPDFGYWYAADGRNAEQQAAFQQVEVRPQALELLFCAAAGHPFRVSLDNLNGDGSDPALFEDAVLELARHLASVPPLRAERWCQALARHYRGSAFSAGFVQQVFLRW